MGRNRRQNSLQKTDNSGSTAGCAGKGNVPGPSGSKDHHDSLNSNSAGKGNLPGPSGSKDHHDSLNGKSGGSGSPSSGDADIGWAKNINKKYERSQSLPGEGSKKKKKKKGRTKERGGGGGGGPPSETLGSPPENGSPSETLGSPPESGSPLSSFRRRSRSSNGVSPRSPAAPPSPRKGITVLKMAFVASIPGFIAFLCAVIGENKMFEKGFLIIGKDGIAICNHPRVPAVSVLGCFSLAFLLLSTYLGRLSVFHPYDGKAIPEFVLREYKVYVFYYLTMFLVFVAVILLVWPTYMQQFRLSRSVRRNGDKFCPTDETGLLGGGGLLCLCCTFLWLFLLLLVSTARDSYFDAVKKDNKGKQVQVRIDSRQN